MLNAIDISDIQSHPDLSGVDVVLIKASEGHTYASPARGDQAKAARTASKAVGWYHFLWPGNIEAQAAWFIRCADPQPGDVLACDWETTLDHTAASCAEKDAFLEAVKKLRPGLRVLLYANLDFWLHKDTTNGCADGLWIADPDAPAGKPRVQHPWLIHQYGIRSNTDQDVCNFASPAAWRQWAAGPAPAPAPKPPVVKPAPYSPPRFPSGLAPGKSSPSAKPLQMALRAAGFLTISDADLADAYGPRTQAAVAKFLDAHPQFRAKGKTVDPAIGPLGWAYLFTLAYGKR